MSGLALKPVQWGEPTCVLGAELAAAGGHNFLVRGATGSGKALAIDYLQAILPDGEPGLDRVDPLAPRRSSEIARLKAQLEQSCEPRSPRKAATLDLAYVSASRAPRYQAVVDLFAVQVAVDRFTDYDILRPEAGRREAAAERVLRARNIQARRNPGGRLNSELDTEDLCAVVRLDKRSRAAVECATLPLDLTARSIVNAIRVARTAADLEEEIEVDRFHVALALCFRRETLTAECIRRGWLNRDLKAGW